MTQTRLPTITEDSIGVLVDTFYTRVRRHPALGPVFEAAIEPADWVEHLATMKRFWSSVMLTSGRYSGNPVAVHRAVSGLDRPLFAAWLAVFSDTASDLFDAAPAAAFITKAQRIATSLQLAVFHRPGDPPQGLVRKPAA
jgi:hemoglobin